MGKCVQTHIKRIALIAILGMVVAMPVLAFDQSVAYDAWRTISRIEKQHDIPKGLLHSMSLVETGGGLDGLILPWPYSICVNRTGWFTRTPDDAPQKLRTLKAMGFQRFDLRVGLEDHWRLSYDAARQLLLDNSDYLGNVSLRGRTFAKKFEGKTQAVSFVDRLIRHGHTNVDIGLMQVNWYYHGDQFKNVAEAFDPRANAYYAVNYLSQHKQTRDWWQSVGRYHSGTPKHAKRYIRSVWEMYQKVHRIEAKKS